MKRYYDFIYVLMVWLTLLASSRVGLGQYHFAYHRLNKDHGFVASESYTIVQDLNNYIWIGTEAGIFCYDGYGFKNYLNPDKKIDNTVLRLHVDYKNRVWFSTYNGYFGYIENGRIHNHPLGRKISQQLKLRFIDHSYIDHLDNIWFMYTNGKIIRVDKNNTIDSALVLSKEESRNLRLKILKHRLFWSNIYKDKNNDSATIVNPIDVKNIGGAALCHMISENEYIYAIGSCINHIKNDKIIGSVLIDDEHLIGSFYVDRNNNLWVNTTSKGIYFFSGMNLDKDPVLVLPDITVSSCFQDKEGNYWFTTMAKEVLVIPSLHFFVIPETLEKRILTFDFKDDQLYYHSYENNITCFNLKTKESKQILLKFKSASIKSLSVYGENKLLLNSSQTFLIDTSSEIHDIVPKNTFSHLFLNDSVVLFSGIEYLGTYDLKNKCHLQQIPVNTTVRSAYQSPEGKIWVATINGLFVYENGTIGEVKPLNEFFRCRINKVESLNQYLLIATKTAGLCIYDMENDFVIKIIDKEAGLKSNNVRSLFVENDSLVWIGMDNGISRLRINSAIPFRFDLTSYEKNNIFPSLEVYEIKKKDSFIYAATDNGLLYFNPSELKNHAHVKKPVIELVSVNGESIKGTRDLQKLESGQNTLVFRFKTLAFRNHKYLGYRYKLLNYDDKWIETNELTARYSHLQPGQYVFMVQATIDGEHYTDSSEVALTINKSFHHTVFFKAIVALALALLLYGIHRYLLYLNRKKNALKFKIYETENKALRSQLNPHFIFNSLCSMQEYVLNKQVKKAEVYLSDLAKLIRLYFENSKLEFVPLGQEIEAIELFIKFEGAHFDGSFKYKVSVDPEIDFENISIPPLLIQPLIENAFKHGLPQKEGDKTLHVIFRKASDEEIICKIIDNGIGRRKASNIEKQKYKYQVSSGLKNIYKQIDLINKMYSAEMSLEIIDPDEGGTIALIRLLCV